MSFKFAVRHTFYSEIYCIKPRHRFRSVGAIVVVVIVVGDSAGNVVDSSSGVVDDRLQGLAYLGKVSVEDLFRKFWDRAV